MNKTALIIGYGSIGKKHAKVLSTFKIISKIYVLSSQAIIPFKRIEKLSETVKLNPDYIVVASPANKHYAHLKFIEKNFRNKKILIEKPLFNKFKNIITKNNKYFVGYNLRFHPGLKLIKKIVNNKKIFFVNVNCSTFLPHWRKNKDYSKSVSAKKEMGGGVLLELSHELDYLNWLFGKLKIEYVFSNKISNLKINTDDVLCLNAISKNKTFINLTINFFSKISKREIFIEGENLSIYCDFIQNKINLYKDGKKLIYKYPKFTIEDTYRKQHFQIISGTSEDMCSINEGLQTLKMIKEIRNFK